MNLAHGPSTASWSSWDPVPLLIVVLIGGAYAYGRRRRSWRARGSPAAFYGGLFVVALALATPLDAAAEPLFSVHMAQHLLLMLVAAPLLALGAPGSAIAAATPLTVRRTLARLGARPSVRALRRWARSPVPVWCFAAAVMWVWHLPALYDAALQDERLHVIEHATFLGSSVLFWSVAFLGRSERALQSGQRVLYLVLAGVQSGALGALLTFARSPLYEAHLELRESWGVDGITLLEDQQLAGVIMWVPAGIVYMGAAAWRFLQWLRAMDAGDVMTVESAPTESRP